MLVFVAQVSNLVLFSSLKDWATTNAQEYNQNGIGLCSPSSQLGIMAIKRSL
jgi:hypothetical protein